MDTKRPFYRLKSDWAAAQAKAAWAEVRRKELEPVRGGNQARKRQQLDNLRAVACEWDRRVARYLRIEGEARAA
jgi:hypothetical protein